MAKRVADTQLTKDGALSDGDGFSDGSQMGGPRRATAAQMAARRLAKPRGSRRPATPGHARPSTSSNQTQPSPFQPSNTSSVNGTQQQQNPFGSLNGNTTNQPNQTSQSFPPFGGSNNSGFNTQFTAPSSSAFNFSAASSDSITNPFARNIPPDYSGFEGNIFTVPPIKYDIDNFVRDREGEEEPKFAAHSPFHNGNQDSNTSQKEPSDNSPTMAAGQQPLFPQFTPQPSGPAQTSSSVFPQPTTSQQQPTSNIFGGLQPPVKPVNNLFPNLGKPESQSQPQTQAPSNIFGQSNSILQQPNLVQKTPNFFAHLGSPQPSIGLGQSSTSPAQEDQSMMSTSPDTSPSSRPFGFLNGSSNQSQSSPTKDTAAPAAGGNLFDRISKPTPEASAQAPLSSTPDTATPKLSGSLFERVSKPTPERNAVGSASSASQPSSQEASNNLFSGITKTANETAAQPSSTSKTGNLFKFQQTPNTQGLSSTPSGDSQPAKKKLFGQTLPPQVPQSSSTPQASTFSPAKGPILSQSGSEATHGADSIVHNADEAAPSNKRKFDSTPDAPRGFTAEEKKQLITGYRLKHFDECMRKRLRSRPPKSELPLLRQFYNARVESISRADGGELESLEETVLRTLKRKAVDKHSTEINKKPRTDTSPQAAPSTLSNGKSPSNSQTSSLFKNILDNKGGQSIANGSADERPASTGWAFAPSKLHVKPSSTSSMPPPPKPTTNSSSSAFSFGADKQVFSTSSTSNIFGLKNNTGASTSAPGPPPSTPQMFGTSAASTPASSSSSNLNSTTSLTSSDTTKTPTFEMPKFGANESPKPASSNPFTAMPATSSDASSTATKDAPVFGPGGSTTPAGSNPFLAQPVTNSEASSDASNTTKDAPAIKAPIFGSGQPSASTGPNLFSSKPSTSSDTSSNSSTAPAFKVPTFGTKTTPNFMAQFGKAAKKTAEEVKNKRKAEEFDSEEEDEATWERRYEEEQRAKKKKLKASSTIQKVNFVNGVPEWTTVPREAYTPNNNANEEEPADPVPSIFDQPQKPFPKSQNIFGHLSGSESGADGSKTGDADDEDEHGSDEEGEDEREGEDHARENMNDEEAVEASQPLGGKHSTLQSNEPSGGLFDRITKDENGNPIRENPKPDAKSAPQASDIFGQGANLKGFSSSSGFATSNSFGRPVGEASKSTADKPSSTPEKHTFGQAFSPLKNGSGKLPSFSTPTDKAKTGESPAGDHTWKADSPITFGGQINPPVVNVTAPSSAKSPFSVLFGAPKANATTESPAKPIFGSVTTSPAKAANNSLGFNFTPAKPSTNSLAAPSNTGSGATSRATSPGATTGESANESSADHDDDHAPPEAQLDLVSGGPGEENEDIIFKVKAKALVCEKGSSDWTVKGLGPLRVLKHRETNATRILMRHDPSGRIVINTYLLKDLKYESPQEKTIRVPIVEESGKVASWILKIGKEDDTKKLTEILMDNRPS